MHNSIYASFYKIYIATAFLLNMTRTAAVTLFYIGFTGELVLKLLNLFVLMYISTRLPIIYIATVLSVTSDENVKN